MELCLFMERRHMYGYQQGGEVYAHGVAYVIPAIRHRTTLYLVQNRFKRDINNGELAASVIFPAYGIGRTIAEIKLLAVLIKSVANDTAKAIQSVTAELVAARTDFCRIEQLWIMF